MDSMAPGVARFHLCMAWRGAVQAGCGGGGRGGGGGCSGAARRAACSLRLAACPRLADAAAAALLPVQPHRLGPILVGSSQRHGRSAGSAPRAPPRAPREIPPRADVIRPTDRWTDGVVVAASPPSIWHRPATAASATTASASTGRPASDAPVRGVSEQCVRVCVCVQCAQEGGDEDRRLASEAWWCRASVACRCVSAVQCSEHAE